MIEFAHYKSLPSLGRVSLNSFLQRTAGLLRSKRVSIQPQLRDEEMTDYARGFLVSHRGASIQVPIWWNTFEFGELKIAADPRVNLGSDSRSVVFLGHAVDIRTGASTPESITDKLSNALKEGASSFQNAVDDLCGRFIVVSSRQDGIRLQADAVGMRSVFFARTRDGVIAGSHPRLVEEQISSGPSPFADRTYLKKNNMAVMPGRATIFAKVLALTPNTELDLEVGTTHRFYYGSSSQPKSVDEAARTLIENTRSQVSALKNTDPLRISLSAGLDSRVTVALLREIVDQVQFFTYDIQYNLKNKASEHDRSTAARIAHHFGFNHEIIEVASRDIPDELKLSLDRNMAKAHSRPLAAAYLESVSGGLHIRSNVYEIGRAYYRSSGWKQESLTAAEMLAIVSGKKSQDPAAVKAFQEFMDSTEFECVQNVDPLDLFYWEHRMGAWMIPIILESDIAHDTHVLVNHRGTLEAMMAVSVQDRIDGSVLDTVVYSEWPELFHIPVNGKFRQL